MTWVKNLLFQLVSLPGQPLDFRFKAVHITNEDSIVLGFPLDVHLQLTLTLGDVHQSTLQ